MSSRSAILVTGGARRVGRALATAFAARGHDVAVHANSRVEDAVELVTTLKTNGVQAVALAADLRDAAATGALIRRAAEALGRPITGLVNNASTFEPDEAATFTPETWDLHFDVNVRAACILARDLAAGLPDGAEGSVVNLIDQRVFRPNPHFFTYALSKATLKAATVTLAQALAPQVRVNAVAPGPVLRNARQDEEDFRKQVEATILGTGSPPDAIVEAVLWLMDARHVTGQTVAVDGGQSLIWRTPDVDGVKE